MKVTGNILKLKAKHATPVEYSLPIGDELIELNPLIGKKIKLSFDGVINCIDTGEKIKKSYNQGYSYKSFITKAACDMCIMKPELCHFEKGTCREPEWGEKHCYQPHVVYLANSSGLKVGITRATQVPTRFIDQGAYQALPMFKVENRHLSGLLEVEIKQFMNDKTNWRKMLKNDIEEIDLVQQKEMLLNDIAEILDDFDAEDLPEEVFTFDYPVTEYPEKITSLSFDKKPIIEGVLIGIKGQYLIMDCGVVNMRKHQGYELTIDC